MADRSPLREYYDAQTPSASCVERLKALEASAETEAEPLPPRRRWVKPLTAAALAAFILGVSLWSNSILNPKPVPEDMANTTAPPEADLAAPTSDPAPTLIPEETAPSAPVENETSLDPVESAAPSEPLPASGASQPPEEGDAGSSSGSTFDPFWWLHTGQQGSNPPGSGSGSSAPVPVPTLPAMGGSGMGLPSPRDMFPGYTFVTNSDGTVYAAHYALGVRHYLFLVSTDGVQKTIDVTEQTTDGVYDADLTVGNHTVHVTLDVKQEGSAALTVY